ncbi:PREDICTED: breast carcinoma-amplified sequence 4 [Myotis brandtii]|uniref:breast carcinoma-amplified sequence 4 n=1 Tax=Myotis brandtii TaxID=109478 RepID=UPI0003BBB2E9|nr:PREDICTED: breast carcinoma-amplified sequence 4 [Myotis brandtii]
MSAVASLSSVIGLAKEVEETIEGMLLRLEEFCSLADMIRSDTSQILEENIPLLKAKVMEMRGIYAKVDRLEAFVKMVGHHVSFLEDHVLRAERRHGAFSQALRRWGWPGSGGLPSFRNNLSRPASPLFELPALYRTEDYSPATPAGGHWALRPQQPAEVQWCGDFVCKGVFAPIPSHAGGETSKLGPCPGPLHQPHRYLAVQTGLQPLSCGLQGDEDAHAVSSLCLAPG